MNRQTAMEQAAPSPRKQRRRLAARRLSEEGLKLIARQGPGRGQGGGYPPPPPEVGKGTFFTHWPTKDAFVAELLDQVLTDLARRVCAPWAWAPTDGRVFGGRCGGRCICATSS